MIYLECDADEVLVKALGVSRREIKHSSDKGDVCNRLEKNRNSKGLVDEDPGSPRPRYIEKLKLFSHESEIKVLYDEKNQNHLIVLCPRLEEWVLKAVKEVRADIGDYSLPNDADKLHEVINVKLRNFVDLLEDIKKRSRMLKTLEGLIKGK